LSQVSVRPTRSPEGAQQGSNGAGGQPGEREVAAAQLTGRSQHLRRSNRHPKIKNQGLFAV